MEYELVALSHMIIKSPTSRLVEILFVLFWIVCFEGMSRAYMEEVCVLLDFSEEMQSCSLGFRLQINRIFGSAGVSNSKIFSHYHSWSTHFILHQPDLKQCRYRLAHFPVLRPRRPRVHQFLLRPQFQKTGEDL